MVVGDRSRLNHVSARDLSQEPFAADLPPILRYSPDGGHMVIDGDLLSRTRGIVKPHPVAISSELREHDDFGATALILLDYCSNASRAHNR